jgi:CHAT domain-containing protein/tetratricopeptide (TPR) repeat protein
MDAPHLQSDWTDEQIAEKLIALTDSQEFRRVLQYRRKRINPSVIERLKDEVAYLIRADIHRAVELADVTRSVATLCDDPVGLALAHHASALAAHFSSQYVEAVEHYEQAEVIYSRLGMEVEAARIARAKIDALMYLGRYGEALQIAEQAREIFKRHNKSMLLAQLEMNVGNIYHRLDQYREALQCYQYAEETFAAEHDEFYLAQARYNAANQYTQLNEFDRALALYQQAQQGFQRFDMTAAVNQTEYSIAWLYFLRGRFHESLKLFAKVREKAAELGDTPLEALCDLDLAEVYLQLNAYEDTLESARSAAEKFSQLKMNYEYAKATMYLGIACTHLNDFPTAERELQEARRVFQAEGNEIYTALSDIYLSDVLTYRQDWEQAGRLCDEAKKLFGEQNLSAKTAYAELQLARLKLLQGEWDEAELRCRSALQLIGEAEAPWLRYQCLHLLGSVKQQAGQEPEAYQYYTQAVEQLEALRSSIRLDEFKCTFLKDKLRVYEDLVELCSRTGTQEKIAEAFAFAEAAKSRSLVDLLAADQKIETKIQEPSVSELHQTWKRLREELDWYYNRINLYEVWVSQRPASFGDQLQKEVHQREQQLARLARQLRLQDAEYSSLQTASWLDMDEVRESLAEDEVLIEYYAVHGQVKVFVLSRETVRMLNDLTQCNAITPLLQRLRFYFNKFMLSQEYIRAHAENMQRLTTHCLQKLYAELIEPIASLLQDKKLIFVPHDVLHYIPFHALHDGRHYLIDQHEISYCPSASVFKLCSEKAQRRRGEGPVLIMGIPDEATPLIYDEVAAVKSLWPEAQVLLGEQATLQQLKQHAPLCRLLHLASHGIFRRDNPIFSALKLADSWLNFYDIFNLNLNADLVTLSACETGMNEVFPGDELFGLMRGFLYAGAPSLVVSLWVVSDRSTAEFMKQFYAGLNQGLSKRAALRQAQLAVKEKYQHPYYWAPFILMGAPL